MGQKNRLARYLRTGLSLALAAPWVAATAVPMPPGGPTAEKSHTGQPQRAAAEGKEMIDRLSVYWVGHSLMNGRDKYASKPVNLLQAVGQLAASQGLQYQATDHTLFGAPLSLNWQGKPVAYARDEPQMKTKREKFEHQAARYDAAVLTETVPVSVATKYEHSGYFLHRFYCAATRAGTRVYLFEGWVHWHGKGSSGFPPPLPGHEWRERMVAERAVWERLADAALSGTSPPPGKLGRLRSWLGLVRPHCQPGSPIYRVAVGGAMVELYDRLREPRPGDDFTLPQGERLRFSEMFVNARSASIPHGLRHPDEEPDDIHGSQIGVYFAALVHFATLYKRSPLGLPSPTEVGERLGRTLQAIAWDTVSTDPRSGVSP